VKRNGRETTKPARKRREEGIDEGKREGAAIPGNEAASSFFLRMKKKKGEGQLQRRDGESMPGLNRWEYLNLPRDKKE